jgi:pimeloyl-ACP methyl ester carboxylesterase
VADALMPALLGATTHRRRPDVAGRVRAMIGAQPAGTIAAATRAVMARPDSDPLLPSIAVPTLVIVGAEDTMSPPSEALRMHAAIPGSTLVEIPGAGHLSNLEHPAAFTAAVSGFVEAG